MTVLTTRHQQAISANKRNNHKDNYDFRRFGDSLHIRLIRSSVQLAKKALGLSPTSEDVEAHLGKLEFLYELLSDRQSQELLLDILAFRSLGHRKVKLPLSTQEYWRELEHFDALVQQGEKLPTGPDGWSLSLVDLQELGYPIQIYTNAPVISSVFSLQQYRCKSSSGNIEPGDGAVVIDAGGCWGDTALYFAQKVGNNGQVHVFEFMPENLDVLSRNLELNPSLAPRIKLAKNAAWSTSGDKLFISGNGPSTRVGPDGDPVRDKSVETLTIDDLAAQRELARVDFIKMDVEGAELAALMGAEESIRKHRPDLAISVYHRLRDFWEIPAWINQLDLSYEFYLGHFTVHMEETVLFARARK